MIDRGNADELLTTTRSVRKRLDLSRPVPTALVQECLDIALQAPTGSNMQTWAFVVVTDPEKRAALADIYRKGFGPYIEMSRNVPRKEGDVRSEAAPRVVDSATYLADHLDEVPVHVIPCMMGRWEDAGAPVQAGAYGSIFPAVWSFMLAARARGLGTVLTTLHLVHEAEAAELLGIPSTVTQVGLVPVAFHTGDTFKPASRLGTERVVRWNGWEGRTPPVA